MSVRDWVAPVASAGRELAVCEAGDPDGTVVLYLHGTGSSRLEVALYDEAAARAGLRLVAWDRPGSGLTAAQPGRRVLDVVGDARRVALAAGEPHPVVAGLSGGGSHVLALATADWVRAAVAVNPGPPADEQHLQRAPRAVAGLVRAARDRPALFRLLARGMEKRDGALTKRLKRRALDPRDVAVLDGPRTGPLFDAAIEEGRAQPRAYTHEALMLWNQPWGFTWAQWTVPVHVCAGRNDPFSAFARQLGDAGAQLHWFDGGHVSGFDDQGTACVLSAVSAATQAPVPAREA